MASVGCLLQLSTRARLAIEDCRPDDRLAPERGRFGQGQNSILPPVLVARSFQAFGLCAARRSRDRYRRRESQDQLCALVKPGGVGPDVQRAAPLRCCSFAAPSIPIENAPEQQQQINRAEVPLMLFTLNYYLDH
jgi:hypothetical protein